MMDTLLNLFLIGVAIALTAFVLRTFIKNRIMLSVVMVILIAVTIIIAYQKIYTTFSDLYSDRLNKDSVVEQISIAINDLSADDIPKRKARTDIDDPEIINAILDDFSGMELKKDDEARTIHRKYQVRIEATNQIKENHLKTESITLNVDGDHVDQYKVINDADHLETIESLVDNKEMDWEDVNKD